MHPVKASDFSSKNDQNYRVYTLFSDYLVTINRNNGVKEQNILRILIPLGMKPSDIDQTLLNALTSFGSNRGDVAHKSQYMLNTLLNPIDALNDVKQIIMAIKSLDLDILQLSL